jgi:thymidylate synthase (FAD)
VSNEAKVQVKLIDFAKSPLEKLYAAFRTCYSSETPIEIWQKIEAEKISREKIRVMPESWERAGMREEFEGLLDQTSDLYARALKAGIPAEDARFVLPNAAPTNFHVMVNFAEMLHICDLRLCVRAQWEIRRMVALMRAEIKRVLPEIAVFLQPKCGENRMGYCDESLDEYLKCPISKVRPHKAAIFEMYEKYGSRKSKPLSETEFRVVEEVETLDSPAKKT